MTGVVTKIVWKTEYACPGNQGGGLSFGWLFFTAFTVSAVVYVGGGVAYNHKSRGMDLDLEALYQIPGHEGWRLLPGLLTDGVYFFRVHAATWHTNLEFLAPSGAPPAPDYDPVADSPAPTGGKAKKKKKGKKAAAEEEEEEDAWM